MVVRLARSTVHQLIEQTKVVLVELAQFVASVEEALRLDRHTGHRHATMNAVTSPPSSAPIKVLLVNDEGLVRSGFKVLLDLEDDITVVGKATNGVEAVEQVRAARPDVVLMD